MKLSPAVLHFTESQGNPSIILMCPGTEFSVLLTHMVKDGVPGIHTTVSPAKYNGDEDTNNLSDEMPDQLDMLLNQAYLYAQSLVHYLSCDKHRTQMRAELGIVHERVERAKIKMPCSTESTLLAVGIAITNGLPMQAVVMLGLHTPHKVYKYSDEELLMINRAKNDQIDPMTLTDDVTLDYVPVIPPLNDAEREAFKQFVADVKAGKVDGASFGHDEAPDGTPAINTPPTSTAVH